MRLKVFPTLGLATAALAGGFLAQTIWTAAPHAQAQTVAMAPQASSPEPPASPDTSAADLLPEELHTVQLFERASPAIVNVDVTARRVDPWSRAQVDVPAGSGSGFLWDDQGHVVTNFHVIRNASSATVTLQDQTQLPARLVGISPDHDLAVLQIEAPPGSVPLLGLPIGRSGALRVGQRVYAIGNPFGLDHTLTTGIVSALDREIQSLTGRMLDGVVQTDAAINPGNSGGPLLNSAGEVVGVNTMIFSPSGASAGVGFAIPIDTVRRVVPQLIAAGKYTRPTLGIRIDDRVAAPILRDLDIQGVLVLGVEPGTAAEEAGLMATTREANGKVIVGDILLALDGSRLETTSDLLNTLERKQPGQMLQLQVQRQGKEMSITLTLR